MPILNWIGKEKVINHHQQVPYRVLEPQYTYGQADSGNLIIHGDNLDALKALLPRYEGKVKLVYIDPPYNTGNESWVYNDNVNDPKIKKWLGEVVGKEGEDLSRHDKWLCMMYPRLKLLQKLLSNDGAIFISIDDNEQANLRLIADEIFGASNFITSFIWRKVDSPNDNKVPITPDHEYILAYAQNKSVASFSQMSAPGIVNAYGKKDENGKRYRDRLLKKNGRSSLRRDRPTMYFSLIAPDGSEVYPTHDNGDEACWAMGKDGVERHLSAGTLVWKQRQRQSITVWEPYTREFAPDDPKRPFPSIWSDLPTMRQAKAFLRSVFNTSDFFSTPKPDGLIERILQILNDPEAIILDSFAGSGTTGHAVLNMNKADGGNRKFILVEMMDYANSITAERVKRVIDGYGNVAGTGSGFTYCELGKRLLMEDGNLNEEIDTEKICEYVWYTETRADYTPQQEHYLLGIRTGTAYYFYYEKQHVTVLDHDFLHNIKTHAGSYLIYADINTLSADEMDALNIRFKKIPRDITRL